MIYELEKQIDRMSDEITSLQETNKKLLLNKDVLKKLLIIHGVSKSFASGKKAIIIDNLANHNFNIGDEAMVVKKGQSGLWKVSNKEKGAWWIDVLDAYVC